MNEKPIFIDEAEPDQALGEARTTMCDDFLSRLLFKAGDFLDQIATGDCRGGPARGVWRWLG